MTDIYSLIPAFRKLMPKFLDKKNIFAVWGVESDPTSNSYKVLKNLKKINIKTFAVNPQEKEIMGEKVYPDIKSLPEKPSVVCIVTLPEKTLNAVKQSISEGIKMIWLDLGSETQEAIDFCEKENISAIYYHSIIKELISPTEKELEKLGKTIS